MAPTSRQTTHSNKDEKPGNANRYKVSNVQTSRGVWGKLMAWIQIAWPTMTSWDQMQNWIEQSIRGKDKTSKNCENDTYRVHLGNMD